MRAKDIKLGIFMMAFSLLLLFWLIPAKVEVFALGTYAAGELGPRSFPYLMASAIGIIGFAIVIAALRQSVSSGGAAIPKEAVIRIVGVLGCSAIYLWLITLFGYMLPTFLATVAFMYLFGERRPWLMALIGIITSVSLFLIFGKVFHMLMPRGSIEFFYEL